MLSRVGKWLSGKKPKDTETESGSVPAPQPERQQAMDTPAAAPEQGQRRQESKAAEKNGAKPAAKKKPQQATKEDRPGGQTKKSHKPKRKRRDTRGKAKSTAEQEAKPAKTPELKCKLLINTAAPEECRIVLIEKGKVEAFFVETINRAQSKGNIYKGRITTVEPNLQAAFVDIGLEKNGFLPFSEIHPEYYYKEVSPDTHWKDLNIKDVVRKGQEVLVEVVKEAAGTKGANITTYLSLPGRYLVLMPGSDSSGISRKIEDEAQRAKLRKMVDSIKPPEGIGYIIRTASEGITKTSLSQDMRYLLNLWGEIKKTGQELPAPALVYREQNIISRFLRDHYTTEIQEILVDNEEAFRQVKNFMELLPAAQRKKTSVRLHSGTQPIFNLYNIEKQIEQIYQPKVPLPSGGSIVINPTEALVAIDVNSGRTSKDKNFEESIFLANTEAAEELARQLRLRDLGGLIVVDFIDMRDSRHTREVEKTVKNSMKKDKAKVDFSRISKFGLMQISRQKMAAPIQMGSYNICPHCQGRGVVRSVETLALAYLRHIQTGLAQKNVIKVQCRLPMEVAQYLLNKKRQDLADLETRYGIEIVVEPDPAMMPAEKDIQFIKNQ